MVHRAATGMLPTQTLDLPAVPGPHGAFGLEAFLAAQPRLVRALQLATDFAGGQLRRTILDDRPHPSHPETVPRLAEAKGEHGG